MFNEKSDSLNKFIYTAILALFRLIFGISHSCFGPTFVDLKHVFNTSIDKIALMTTFLNIGYNMGSLFGFVYKYINRQLTLTVLLLLMGISCLLIPYSEQLWHLYFLIWVFGLGAGALSNATHVWTIEMWQHNSAPVLQLMGFIYGIGNILGPLIDKPFLTGEPHNNFDETLVSNLTIIPNINLSFSTSNTERRTKLKIPFLIIGLIQLIVPILLTIMYLLKRYENQSQDTTLKTENNYKKKLFDSRNSTRKLIIILVSIFLAFHLSSATIYNQLSATYLQFIPLQLTASKAAEIVAVMALTYTIGCGISVFISVKIKPENIIAIHLVICFIAMAVLFFGQNSIVLIWIGSLTMSFGISSIIPSTYGFMGRYLEVTDRIGTILLLSSGTLTLFSPYVLSFFIEKYPNSFIHTIISNVIIDTFLLIIIIYIVKKTMKKKILENIT